MFYHDFQTKKFSHFFDIFTKPIGLLFCKFFNIGKGCNVSNVKSKNLLQK